MAMQGDEPLVIDKIARTRENFKFRAQAHAGSSKKTGGGVQIRSGL
jgi:hypothetical protein